MQLHILGSAGYHPNDTRQTTCLMIPELGIILDAGSGFYRVHHLLHLVPESAKLEVFLSHAHLDHVIGLTYGITVFWPLKANLLITGRQDHLMFIDEHLFYKRLFPLRPGDLGYYPNPLPICGDAHGVVNGVPYRTTNLSHDGGSVGYRFALPNGRDLAYITDSETDKVPLEFLDGVHTLIHECSFADELADIALRSRHSTTSQALELARKAGVKRLVLIHLNAAPEIIRGPGADPVGPLPDNLPYELIVGYDNLVVEL